MRTWLLPCAPVMPGDPVNGLLRALGLPNTLLARPPAWLGLPGGGRPRLRFRTAADRNAFFAQAHGCLAFATSPGAGLAGLRPTTFTAPGAPLVVRRSARADLPYLDRLVEFSAGAVEFVGETVVGEGGGDPLFLAPHPLKLDQTQQRVLEAAFANWRAFLQNTVVIVLPPARPVGPESYFRPDRVEARAAVQAAWPAYPAGEAPALVALAAATDHPALRDWLADGAGLWLTGGDGTPTEVCLRVPRADGGTAGYRAAFAFRPAEVPVADDHRAEVRAVARAVRSDLRTAVGRVRPAGPPLPADPHLWQVPDTPPDEVIHYREPGTWRQLSGLAARLPPGPAGLLREMVLDPTAGPTGGADNNRAETALLRHFLCCPDPCGDRPRAWREAAVALLADLSTGTPSPAADRLPDEVAVREVDGARWVWHPRRVSRRTLWRWRLLAPLGWRLPERAAVLDGAPACRVDRFRLW